MVLNCLFCAVAEKHFKRAMTDETEFNLHSFVEIRSKFIESFFEKDYIEYSNVLFDYQKFMWDKNFFDAYNYYLFQIGNEKEFDEWLSNNNRVIFNYFYEWYGKEVSQLKITDENRFLR